MYLCLVFFFSEDGGDTGDKKDKEPKRSEAQDERSEDSGMKHGRRRTCPEMDVEMEG